MKSLLTSLCLLIALPALPQIYVGQSVSVGEAMPPTGGGGASWTPTNEPSTIAWFNGDTPALANGATVSKWTDSSLNGTNTLYLYTATPVYTNSAHNGHSAVDFIPYGGFMTNVLQMNIKPLTYAFIIRTPDSSAGDGTIFNASAGNHSPGFDVNSGNLRLVDPAVAVIGQCPVIYSNWYYGVVTYDSSGNYAFTTNGVAGPSGNVNETFTTQAGGIMGAADMAGSSGYHGIIEQFIIANTNWSSTAINSFNTWASGY